MGALKQILKGPLFILVGLMMLWVALDAWNRDHRLDVNPHVSALIERTWTTSGKHSSRYANLSFPGPDGLCRAYGVRLGSSSLYAATGQHVEIAPLPGTCDHPDAVSARESGWVIALEFAFAFVAFLSGVLMLVGMIPSRPTTFGFQRRYG